VAIVRSTVAGASSTVIVILAWMTGAATAFAVAWLKIWLADRRPSGSVAEYAAVVCAAGWAGPEQAEGGAATRRALGARRRTVATEVSPVGFFSKPSDNSQIAPGYWWCGPPPDKVAESR
jgi:hypothetical protein